MTLPDLERVHDDLGEWVERVTETHRNTKYIDPRYMPISNFKQKLETAYTELTEAMEIQETL
jgi:hypothetical protein